MSTNSTNFNSADAHSVFLCIPLDICNIVAEYTVPLKLLDWININKINWDWLSLNPAAIQLLKRNPDKINWDRLSFNRAAMRLLEKNPDKINCNWLSFNTANMRLFETNPDKINRAALSKNSKAMWDLKKNPDKINWEWLSLNPEIFEKNLSEIKKMGEYLAKFKN